MKAMSFVTSSFLVCAMIWLPAIGQAAPAGTAFSYQGQLKDAGVPADGRYDFEFTLYDSATLGSVVAGPVSVPDWPVSGGLFTLPVDFGDGAFNGEARWVRIGVRPWDSTGLYTYLDPRQELTPTPYALHAASALSAVGVDGHSLDAADGSPADALFVDSQGDVGIGTSSADSRFVVERDWDNNITPIATFRTTGSNSAGAVRFENGAGSEFNLGITAANQFALGYNANIGLAGDLLRITSAGNVGIGTTSPGQRLSVNGLIESKSGGFKFPDGTTQTTAGGAPLWQQSGSNIYYDSGNVGIGITSPSADLDISGDVQATGSAAIGTTLHSEIGLYVYTNTLPYGMYSLNAKAGGMNTGIRGAASGTTTGDNYGMYGESSGSSSSNYGVYGFAGTPGAGNNYGVYGYGANTGTGSGYAGFFSGDVRTIGRMAIGTDINTEVTMNVYTDADPYGLYCENAKTGGMNTAIRGSASGTTTGDNYGMYGESSGSSSKNYGVYGFAGMPSAGTNYGVYAYGANSGAGSGYAGFFSGTTILYGNVGVSTTSIPVGRRINTDTGAYLSTGGTWTNSSSRDRKENIEPADGRAVLEKLVKVPVSTWNYKAEDAAIRHIGPMSQDLYEAFELNGNDETISTIDAGGLSFAAIQGLYQIIQEQQKQIEAMKSQIDRLETNMRNQQ